MLEIEGDAELAVGAGAGRALHRLACVPALVVLAVVPEGLVPLAEQAVVAFLRTHRPPLRSDHSHWNLKL